MAKKHIAVMDENSARKFNESMKKNHYACVSPENIFTEFYKTKPIAGYVKTENFPLCCEKHKAALNDTIDTLKDFPNCCEPHKKLGKQNFFDIKNYVGLEYEILDKIAFTEYHISERINIEDWYNDITNYLEYTIESFGQPAVGLNPYMTWIVHSIQNCSEIPNVKQEKLIYFLENCFNEDELSKQIDFNMLFETFKKWFKVFPFELEYFKIYKEQFQKSLPILVENPVYNPYTNLTKAKIPTKKELLKSLVNMTEKLLDSIDTVDLLNNGAISNIEKYEIDLMNENHRKKQKNILNIYSKSERKYFKILKDWLANEKEYFKEFSANIKTSTVPAAYNKKETVNMIQSTDISNLSEQLKILENIYFRYDFDYFLRKNIDSNNYSVSDLEVLKHSFETNKSKLEKELAANKIQCILYIETELLKCHYGGALPTHFKLNDQISFEILRFDNYGEIWALFDIWKSNLKVKIDDKPEILKSEKVNPLKKVVSEKLTNSNIKLIDIWVTSKVKEMHQQLSKLNGIYIKIFEEHKYEYIADKHKYLVAISEIWKDKGFIKMEYQGFKNQSKICYAICNSFGLSDKAHGIYKNCFIPSICCIDGKLNPDIELLKKQILLQIINN